MALVLYIEPKKGRSSQPVDDKYIKPMSDQLIMAVNQYIQNKKNPWVLPNPNAIWGIGSDSGDFTPEVATMGIHTCICGATSTTYDIKLPNGFITNSLANHYLLWHRDEVPEEDLRKLDIAFGI